MRNGTHKPARRGPGRHDNPDYQKRRNDRWAKHCRQAARHQREAFNRWAWRCLRRALARIYKDPESEMCIDSTGRFRRRWSYRFPRSVTVWMVKRR